MKDMKQIPKKLRNRYRRMHTAITIAITIVYMAFDHYEQMEFECVKSYD